MSRVTRALIDLSALRHNLTIVQQHCPDAKVLCVIKADAYGHGMSQIARALPDVDALAVASLAEAIALRAQGITAPVVLLEGFTQAADLNLIRQYGFEAVVHHESQVEMLEADRGAAIPVWLKIDTGMHRLGINPDFAASIFRRLLACSAARPVAVMSHLACADERLDDYTNQQIAIFTETTNGVEVPRSLLNSGGILGWPQAQCDWVRPGIMLYGASPFGSGTASDENLLPVMTLQAELIAVNQFNKGDTIGYSRTWTCPEDMSVGVVSIGYGDGYPRHAKNGTPVLLNGKRAELIGRVSMDMITIDLRQHPDAKIGDTVTLWGEGLPVDEIATAADTIAYELLCGVTKRVRFEYNNMPTLKPAS